MLPDGTQVHWFLGESKDDLSYAPRSGYTLCLYKNEIYDFPREGPARASRQRNFGVGHPDVRNRVTLIVEPPHYDPKHRVDGVSPVSARTRLEWNAPTTGEVAGDLPWFYWGRAFQNQMPEPIVQAIAEAQNREDETDEDFAKDLDQKFGGRWRATATRIFTNIPTRRKFEDGIDKPRKPRGEGEGGSEPGTRRRRRPSTPLKFKPRTKQGTEVDAPKGAFIPEHHWDDDETIFEPGMIASYAPAEGECGTIYLNRNHPVIKEEVARYQDQYEELQWHDIKKFVLEQYAQLAVTAVAHSQYVHGMQDTMRDPQNPEAIEKGVLSPAALTMTMLGIKAQEAVIKPGLGGKFGRRSPGQAAA